MRHLSILSALLLTCGIAHSQIFYYTNCTKNNITEGVEVIIDTTRFSDGIKVVKNFYNQEISENLYNQNSLDLLGDFEINGNEIALNYQNYNYYWVLFDPDLPFVSVNYTVKTNNTVGTLYIGGDTVQERRVGNGDLWYYCNCGDDRSSLDGCLSLLNGKVADCVSEGCPSHCTGFAIVTPRFDITGGGVFIQVSKEKSTFYHNFNTRR